MKAARFVGPGRIDVQEVPKPELPPPGAEDAADRVIVRTQKAAVCGSDMPFFLGRPGIQYPAPPGVPGHECIGTVVESRAPDVKEGDEVLALPIRDGGFAEFFLSARRSLVPLPGAGNREELLMGQPLGTVIHALRKLDNLLNATAVVVGQGPIGLLFTAMLRSLGAKEIIGADLFDNRLAVSRAMGATRTVNASREDFVERVRESMGGSLADLVIEAVGTQNALNQCIWLTRRNGTILSFGVPESDRYTLDFGRLFGQEIRLVSSIGPEVQVEFPLALRMISEGRIDVSPLVTHRLPFEQIEQAFDMATRHKDMTVKTVLEF